jgi:hypothetical protein
MAIDFNGDGFNVGLTDNDTFFYQGTVSSDFGNVNINNFTTIRTVTNTTGTAFLRASNGNLTVSNDNTGNPINLIGSSLTIADMSWEASSDGASVTINNTLNINIDFGLDIRGTGPTDKVDIISKSNTATALVNSITNKGAGTNNVRVSTQGNIYFEGNINTAASFVVLDTGDFTALGDVSSGLISVTSNLGINTTVISFNQNVTATGSFSITNLGNKVTPGAQIYINRDAITTATAGLTFNVGGNFSAATTGGLYNLFICGQTATVGNNITIANKGSLTLGTVNIPLNPPNGSITSQNGFFDASAITGPTNLFMDIVSSQYVSINGDVLVRSANSGTINRNFTIQAQNGDLDIVGQIQLLDNPGNTALGSDLTLWAGILPDIDLGNINIQSVIGVNRTLIINDCQNFNSTGSVQVKSSKALVSPYETAKLGSKEIVSLYATAKLVDLFIFWLFPNTLIFKHWLCFST